MISLMKLISNSYQGTIKYIKNEIRYEIHYSYCFSGGSGDTQIQIDMVFINDKDFSEEFEQILYEQEIINFIKENL